jgi:hypothetical protein
METNSNENSVLERPASARLASLAPEDRQISAENTHGESPSSILTADWLSAAGGFNWITS